MCTAANYLTKCHYFGRNFDYELSYHEQVIITPKKYLIKFRNIDDIGEHHAIIGIAAGVNDYPLYYDACNDEGLAMAGLNFPDYCDYKPLSESKVNVTSFEFIPYILAQCKNVKNAEKLLDEVNISNISFSKELPTSPLHWIISDKKKSIVVESVKEGLNVYDNPVGILTNNPPFDKQLFNLNNYRGLSNASPENTFGGDLDLAIYTRGMGSIGLPGDMSSPSRFVKATFVKENSISGESEKESVSQFFHILASVEQQKGCTLVENGQFEYTIYSDCYNADKGILYYKTYDGDKVAVDMNEYDLESGNLINFPLIS